MQLIEIDRAPRPLDEHGVTPAAQDVLGPRGRVIAPCHAIGDTAGSIYLEAAVALPAHMYKGFPFESLQDVLCGQHGCSGQLQCSAPGPFLLDAVVRCCDCNHAYKIQNGILRLLAPAALDAESAHERFVRDEQAVIADYEWESEAWTQKEIVPTLKESEPLKSSRVLELGAGTGRYSVRMAERGAHLIAADFSFVALASLAQRVKPDWSIGLIEADCTQLRVRRSFDLVASTLMSNLPTIEHRQALYKVVANALREGGKFVFSTHHFSWQARLERKARSGYYREGGIYRYLFEVAEIRREVARHFESVSCRPIQIHIPLAGRFGAALTLSRLSERIWPLNRLGELLLVTAKRPTRKLMAFVTLHLMIPDALYVAEFATVIL